MAFEITNTTEARMATLQFRRDASLDCPHDQTLTPGVFFHGSPNVNIRSFSVNVDRSERLKTQGVFFTHSPSYSAFYAAHRSAMAGGIGGRIYSARLQTRNPYFPGPSWFERIIDKHDPDDWDRATETEMIIEARAAGYDSIITIYQGDTIFEIIALQDDIIRPLENDVSRLTAWNTPRCLETLTMYQVETLDRPAFAKGCVKLVAKRKEAEATGLPFQKVIIDALNPVYCVEAAWRQMNFDLMRYSQFDCLVDPHGRGALVIDPDRLVPIVNRKHLRLGAASFRQSMRDKTNKNGWR